MENAEKYIPVCECEGEDFMEIPLESDGTLSTATVSAYFPGVTGLKFRLDAHSPYRAVRLHDGKFHAPEGRWTGHKFYCVHPKGRTIVGSVRLKDPLSIGRIPVARSEFDESPSNGFLLPKCFTLFLLKIHEHR